MGRSMKIYRWIYSDPGDPMWEWPGLQAVMFYMPDPPFSTGGPPPMSDSDWRRFEEHHNRRTKYGH